MPHERKHTNRAESPQRWWTVLVATALVAGVTARVLVSQQIPKPTAPGTGGDPTWHRLVRLSDGRTFVTDGGLAIDAALAKPAVLPAEVLGAASAKVLEGYLVAPHKDEFALAELRPTAASPTYTAPSGVVLNATYINYLRRILAAATLRFRMKGDLEPVVILSNGRAVGVLMPVRR